MDCVLYSHSASLFTHVYKWIPVNIMPGLTLRWTSISSRRGGGGGAERLSIIHLRLKKLCRLYLHVIRERNSRLGDGVK